MYIYIYIYIYVARDSSMGGASREGVLILRAQSEAATRRAEETTRCRETWRDAMRCEPSCAAVSLPTMIIPTKIR